MEQLTGNFAWLFVEPGFFRPYRSISCCESTLGNTCLRVLSVFCLHFFTLLEAETNQELIMAQGGIGLLARTADDAEDPQTLRMVAGAIANLCGNGTLTLNHFIG